VKRGNETKKVSLRNNTNVIVALDKRLQNQ